MSNATQAFQSVLTRLRTAAALGLAAALGASLMAALAAADAGPRVGACVAGAVVAPELEQAAMRMADAAPSAISRLETCNVYSSCDPGHPSAAGRVKAVEYAMNGPCATLVPRIDEGPIRARARARLARASPYRS